MYCFIYSITTHRHKKLHWSVAHSSLFPLKPVTLSRCSLLESNLCREICTFVILKTKDSICMLKEGMCVCVRQGVCVCECACVCVYFHPWRIGPHTNKCEWKQESVHCITYLLTAASLFLSAYFNRPPCVLFKCSKHTYMGTYVHKSAHVPC